MTRDVNPVRNWWREYEDRAPFVNQGVLDNAEAEERDTAWQIFDYLLMIDLLEEIRREDETNDEGGAR